MSWFRKYLYDFSKAERTLKVATVAMQCDLSPKKNLERMTNFIQQIKEEQPQVELIFFGETILGWYFNPGKTKEYHEEIAETVPGEATNHISQLAKDNQVYISFGMTEKIETAIYNSQIVIDSQGEIVAIHRKVNMRDDTFTASLQPVTVVEINEVKTATIICYDAQSVKVTQALKKQKPDLILRSLADDEDPNFFGAGFLARNYGTWIITANRFGDEGGHYWNGHMYISNPMAELCCKGFDKEQYFFYELAFVGKRRWLKRFLHRSFLKFSIVSHVLKNLGTAAAIVSDRVRVLRKRGKGK